MRPRLLMVDADRPRPIQTPHHRALLREHHLHRPLARPSAFAAPVRARCPKHLHRLLKPIQRPQPLRPLLPFQTFSDNVFAAVRPLTPDLCFCLPLRAIQIQPQQRIGHRPDRRLPAPLQRIGLHPCNHRLALIQQVHIRIPETTPHLPSRRQNHRLIPH